MNIEFIWPYAAILAILPFIIRRFLAAEPDKQAALTVPQANAFKIASEDGRITSTSVFRYAVLWMAWIFLILALCRPQIIGESVSLPTSGRDLMLGVDISGSMSTEDMQLRGTPVTRLSIVKGVVSDFISNRSGDRVGLILFGPNAYVQAPLTFDLKTVEKLLIEAPVGIAGGKTAIGDAIGLATKRLKDRPSENRVLILLTDGSNNVGELSPQKAAALAKDIGVRIHTVGVGADELELRSLFGFGRRMVNPSADLDEETLRNIADTTGGNYFRAADTETLVGIYDEINKLEPVEQDEETFRPTKALYYWPLAIATVLIFSLFFWRRELA